MKITHVLLTSLCWCLNCLVANPTVASPSTWPSVSTRTTPANIQMNEVIRSSFRSGSAQTLAAHFDRQLELLIDTEAVDFPEVRAKHAELILNTFFKKHPPQGFQYVYQGGSERLRYITGLYQTGGKRFSVYLLMRQDARHRFVINTLHLRRS